MNALKILIAICFHLCYNCYIVRFMDETTNKFERNIMNYISSIELFSIGTELIMGQIQDTNSHWIAQKILEIGGNLRRITIIPDDYQQIIQALNESIKRGTEFIITTGGMGPTPDDMTVQAVTELVESELILHEPTIRHFMKRGKVKRREDVSQGMIKMATIPKDAEVYQNPTGWAPCVVARKEESTIFILPGPPREMKPLFSYAVEPFIAEKCNTNAVVQRIIVDMHESEVSPFLQEVMQQYPQTYLKAYVALRDSTSSRLPVDIVATGENTRNAQDILKAALDYLENMITEYGKSLRLE